MNFLNSIFNKQINKLPTINEWSKHISFDRIDDDYKFMRLTETSLIRNKYNEYCFPILSHEFLTSLNNFCLQFKKIIEVGCGSGWLSYWLNKYGINVYSSIDNKTINFFDYNYLDFVKNEDAILYIQKELDVDLIIMSWPDYDVSFAYDIWKSMKKNQNLLYIGESYGGCTANDDFFDNTNKYVINDRWSLRDNFRSFWGMHDRPIIFKK